MIQSTDYFDELSWLDWEPLNSTETELSPEQLHRAAQLSQTIHQADQRWQVYLSALGALGFQQWISDRASDLTLDLDRASIWQPGSANLLSAACSVRVNRFKLCVISVGSSGEETIQVPIAALDLPDLAAHFYVVMQVLEEEEKTAVLGFFTYEQFRQASLVAESDWTYSIPRTWLNFDPNLLLLNLRCLESSAIRLPAITNPSTVALRERLSDLRSQLRSQPPWEVLTPEEGLTFISDPTLVQTMFETIPATNIGLWLNNQLDTVAQTFGWILMPLPAVSQMRALQDFDSIRSSLEQRRVQIPATARGAYRTLRSTNGSVRLYAVTWMLSASEWTLLIALGAEPETPMPRPLTLEVRDEAQCLFEQTLEETEHSILYAQVIGDRSEQFQVLVSINQDHFEIPKFGFDLEPSN